MDQGTDQIALEESGEDLEEEKAKTSFAKSAQVDPKRKVGKETPTAKKVERPNPHGGDVEHKGLGSEVCKDRSIHEVGMHLRVNGSTKMGICTPNGH